MHARQNTEKYGMLLGKGLGRYWDATGTLLGCYCARSTEDEEKDPPDRWRQKFRKLEPMRDDTVPSLLIILPSHIEAPLTPPAFNVEQHIGQWTCEINSLRAPPPLGVLPALRLDNIEVRGGRGTQPSSYITLCLLAKYLPSPVMCWTLMCCIGSKGGRGTQPPIIFHSMSIANSFPAPVVLWTWMSCNWA